MAKRKTMRKKTARKRRAPARRKKPAASTKAVAANRKAQWAAYTELQKRADKAWKQLRSHVARRADLKTLIRDKNQLLLLLGECNYMARECARASRGKKRR